MKEAWTFATTNRWPRVALGILAAALAISSIWLESLPLAAIAVPVAALLAYSAAEVAVDAKHAELALAIAQRKHADTHSVALRALLNTKEAELSSARDQRRLIRQYRTWITNSADLSGLDLSSARLTGTTFDYSRLRSACVRGGAVITADERNHLETIDDFLSQDLPSHNSDLERTLPLAEHAVDFLRNNALGGEIHARYVGALISHVQQLAQALNDLCSQERHTVEDLGPLGNSGS